MPKQELDLIQFAAGYVAQPSASAAQVVRSELLDACAAGGVPDNLPQHFRRHPTTPDPASLVDRAKERTISDVASLFPLVDRHLHAVRNRDCTDVSGFPHQVGDDPVLLSQLD